MVEIRQEPESSTLLRSKPRPSPSIEAAQPANPFLASLFNSQTATLNERMIRRSVRSTPRDECGYYKAYDCAGNCLSVYLIDDSLRNGRCDDGPDVDLACLAYKNDKGACGFAGSSCGDETDQTFDCNENCFYVEDVEEWLGDGFCDDGTGSYHSGINLNCPIFEQDKDDCYTEPGWYCSTDDFSEGSYDCNGRCFPSYLLEWEDDGICDNGIDNVAYGRSANLTCPAFNNDGTDCTSAGTTCGLGMIYDCVKNCTEASKIAVWQGDGVCDDGQNEIDLSCSAFNEDGGDCPVAAEARITTFSYDSESGYLSRITDALNREVVLILDQVGRVTTQILPDSRQIHYEYDENGNTISITPPSKPVHEFDYTAVDLQQQYTPPTVTNISAPQTQYAYNLDKQLIQIQRPDGQTIDFVYDAVKKRLNRIELPNNESISYTYDESTGQLMTLTAPNGSTLSYTYDGSLALSETWSNGDINSTVTRDYNNDFRVTAINVNGNPVNYQYDNDGLLTQAGELSLTRQEDNGLLIQTQLGDFTTQRTYNAFGEVARETVFYGEQVRYNTSYQRDKLGRITQKTETVEGVTTTYDYRYDVTGRLVEVKQDDVIVEAYTYDDNGNRLTAETVSGTIIASNDDQDRLTQYGNATYTYTDNGELRRKDENGQFTEYDYDVLGNLQTVLFPDGKQIEYVIDGRNRRIGKKVNGVLTQSFLYQGSLNPIAELDGEGNVVSRFVYGSKANVPDYMLKDGKTYRILSNHLGSPKLVVDISNGSVVQRMDYDAFGNVLEDSNPSFQPFGFAGGIYDLDTLLTRFGARDYDAEIGRWTAKDPILFAGGDANLYGYVLNNPVNFVDLSGFAPKDKWYGYNDKNFQDWAHQQKQDMDIPANQNFTKEEVKDLAEQWESEGSPRGKGGKSGRGGKSKKVKTPGIVPMLIWEILQEMCRMGIHSGIGCLPENQPQGYCPIDAGA